MIFHLPNLKTLLNMNPSLQTTSRVRLLRTFRFWRYSPILWLCSYFLMSPLWAQVNTGGTATTANHSKHIIGYIDNWSAWKSTTAGVPEAGALTHLNIDYSKYTILNFSFFGVAQDGSLHSGDWRNKNIYQESQVQAPAPLLRTPTFDSWDWILLYGETKNAYYFGGADGEALAAQGFVEGGDGWIHTPSGITAGLPAPMHVVGGAPGLFELCDQNGVKLMASIGGWSMCKHFPEMAADPVKRQNFIDDCVRLINMGFDGIDLDWEYPGPFSGMNFTGTAADYANYVTLITELRAALDAIRPGLYITAAIGASPTKFKDWQWSQLVDKMDIFNFMTYDLNGGWSNQAGHNSPIFDYTGSEYGDLNWQATLDQIKASGIPLNKVTFGLPFYGRGVITDGPATLNAATLKRSETVSPDGPIVTCADYTNWPKEVYDGTPNHFFIEQKKAEGWTEHWDNQGLVPYLTKDEFFLSYDNERSIGDKAKFVNREGLGGVIVWTVYGDLTFSGTKTDIDGKLKTWSNVGSPLINVVNEVFASGATDVGGDPCTDCNTNQFPTVSLSAPAGGSSSNLGNAVTVSANASDADGSVTGVEFFANGSSIGTDNTAPYSVSWTAASAGSYSLTAKATDNEGAQSTSTAVAVSVVDPNGNQPPSVSISSPTEGTVYEEGTDVNVTVAASDADGVVAQVELFLNGSSFGTDNSAPYTFTVSGLAPGTYALTAQAIDNEAATATSAQVNIEVNAISGGCNGIPVWDPATAYGTGDQVKYNGRIFEAKYWTQNQNPETTDPWKHTTRCDGYCDGLPDYLSGKAYTQGTEVNYQGAKYRANTWTTSDPSSADWTQFGSCTGGPGNVAPTATLTAPANGAAYTEGQAITLTANASDADGSVAKVEFFDGSTKLGEDTSAPYAYTWSGASVGNHSLTAIATDNLGATGTSAVLSVSVSGSGGPTNVPPTVSLTAPASGNDFDEGTAIAISADAADSDGSVTLVEFFAGGTKVGEDATAPYSVSWSGAAAGSYDLTAIATDDSAAATTSAVVSITVSEVSTGGCDLPVFVISQVYYANDRVQHEGNAYRATTTIHSVYPNDPTSLASGWWVDEGPCGPSVSVNAPSNLAAGATTTSSITLSWTDNANNEEGFRVVRDGSAVATLAANSTSYTDAGLNAGTSYTYQVQAYLGTTNSAYSNLVTASTDSDPNFVAAPTNLAAQSVSTSQINLTWVDNATIETGYVVERGGVAIATLGANATSYSDAGLAEATTYSYRVKATGSNADSDYSNSASATTQSSSQNSGRLLVGYWHNFLNNSMDQNDPLKLSEISNDWDHINVSFGEPTFGSTSNIDLVLDNAIYPNGEQEFKNDIATLQAQGKKVVLSIGGANGTVILNTTAERDEFISSVVGLIQEYGFDGVDIDFEGSSMALQSGDYDVENPTTPSVVNLIYAVRAIRNQSGLGNNFVLTMAPETYYVQGGASSYGSGGSGAYLPAIHALRDILTYIHVQHYNTGCMIAPDGQCYSSGNANFHVAMADMLLAGFDINSPANRRFQPLREDQVLFGIPASTQAAGSGYTSVTAVKAAVEYLITGNKPAGVTYTLQNPAGYPGFRGLMTWSINWDRVNNFEFTSNYRPFLDAFGSARGVNEELGLTVEGPSNLAVYPNPFGDQATISLSLPHSQTVTVEVLNGLGQQMEQVYDGTLSAGQHNLQLDAGEYPSGWYIIHVTQGNTMQTLKLLKQ